MGKFKEIEWTKISDALHNLSETSGASTEYAKGVLIGVVAALMAFGMEFKDAFSECMKRFPVDFRIKSVPSAWVKLERDWIGINLSNVVSYKDLIDGLPDDTADEVKEALLDKYLYVVATMANHLQHCVDPLMVMTSFRKAGSQWIAEWAVKDVAKKDDPSKFNWHLQNTSQWVYAGALLVQDGRVSIHT